jgi:glucose-6-phosphate-specific signal transduction histidine kinase
MVLGAIWCPHDSVKRINDQIRLIKTKNRIAKDVEMKWTKTSPSKMQLFQDLINYFFDETELHFRGFVVTDKSSLNREKFNQTHDLWYYKLYFEMLNPIFSPINTYEIYIDIKDTHSNEKIKKLHEVCCNSIFDFSGHIINKMQPIRSDEIQIMQILDILIGALGYNNRVFSSKHEKSIAKVRNVDLKKLRSGYSMEKSTLLREEKLNMFFWKVR